MKKILVAGMVVCCLAGCHLDSPSKNEVQAETTTTFPYQYKILDIDVYGGAAGEPHTAAIIQVENKIIAVNISEANSEVSYDQLVGSMLYSTQKIKNGDYAGGRKLKIQAK